ncbi:MAG: hypothetical protein ACMXX9_00115 [Candidatus Woesearchaeota archaeon]
MKKANVSPIVLFLLLIAIAVSLLSFFFSITERLIDSRSSCENTNLQVDIACYTGTHLRLDITNKGSNIDSIKLIVWGEADDELILPQTDLVSNERYELALPVQSRVDRIAIIPIAAAKECRDKSYIIDEVSC